MIFLPTGSSPHTRGAHEHRVPARRRRGIIPAYAGSTRARTARYLLPGDHPRIRGEHWATQDTTLVMAGSSPHTRGAPKATLDAVPEPRIIPAYAGSTLDVQAELIAWRDHPRIRGEHVVPLPGSTLACGSSPHTRGAPTTRAAEPSTWKDHPRIRGEHPGGDLDAVPYGGSSPHTRGAPKKREDRENAARIIPAYAGSTSAAAPSCESREDHPRIRGEHQAELVAYLAQAGSSPHTRGALRACMPSIRRRRIIPAYAGSTFPSGPGGGTFMRIIPAYAGSTPGLVRCERPGGDHPRIRGEHSLFSSPSLAMDGSSPHTRGAHPGLGRGPHGRRIIPAYAGSTSKPPREYPVGADHPRIRGEHGVVYQVGYLGGGSSPHTRGARGRRRQSRMGGRIIPAYAGSTLKPLLMPSHRPDHPRIRGEHTKDAVDALSAAGSSPHTRGALQVIEHTPSWKGIIPAYAGSTDGPHTTSRAAWDHPRIRGEHSVQFPKGKSGQGSSPHTRGALERASEPAGRDRIIPAYAGSTSPKCTPCHGIWDHPRIRGEHRA